MSRAALIEKLKEWPQRERDQLAAALLILEQKGFHGSKTIHYADGRAKTIVDTVKRDLP